MIPRVFLSRPSVVTPEQETALELWNGSLHTMGLEPIIPSPLWAEGSLWTSVRRNMETADGVLILGLRQLRIDKGCWRPGTVASADPAGWWPTPWNHVEAGMAIMAGLPILVVHEDGIAGGVFDSSVWTDGVYGAELNSASTDEAVVAWAGDVFARYKTRMSSKQSSVG